MYSQWDGIFCFLQVGDVADSRYISADKTGRLSIKSRPSERTYYGPGRVADEGLTFVVHEELTTLWRDRNTPEEIKGLWPAFLCPAKEPTVIRDKDGVDRKIFPAVLAKRPFHEQFRFTVNRVRKQDFYPDLRLLGSGRYSIRGLCIFRGEVYYGNVTPNQFDKPDWTDYLLPDAPFLVTKWDGKFRLLSVTEEGEVKLTDRATVNTYWSFSTPEKEAVESAIKFEMHNFKTMRDSREVRYLVPDEDKPVVVKDNNGQDVQLFRLKLGKEPKFYRIGRHAP